MYGNLWDTLYTLYCFATTCSLYNILISAYNNNKE